MTLQFEKFALRSLDEESSSAVVINKSGTRYQPPSFMTDFSEHNKEKVEEPPAPTFSEDDVNAAKQQSYQKGFLEGASDAQQQAKNEQTEIDRNLTVIVQQLATQIQQMIDSYNAFAQEQLRYLPPLALAIARKVAGKALDENPLPMIESVVSKCLGQLLGEPHIIITVSAELSDALEQRLIAQFADNNQPGEITIAADEKMQGHSCLIQWANGQAERSTEKLWQEMESIIQDMVVASGQRETTAPIVSEQIQTPLEKQLPPAQTEASVELAAPSAPQAETPQEQPPETPTSEQGE